jgi:hypothetical protein
MIGQVESMFWGRQVRQFDGGDGVVGQDDMVMVATVGEEVRIVVNADGEHTSPHGEKVGGNKKGNRSERITQIS